MQLIGSRVLVTGASRGIGAAVARRFAAVGANVALAARDAERLADLADELDGTAHPVDLADPTQVEGFVARVEQAGGPLDVLVNNAGVEYVRAFDQLTPLEIAALYQLNLVTPVQLCRQAIPLMWARGRGTVVNVSSASAAVALPGITTYASSKAALSAFGRALDLDLLGSPVRSMLVEPGFVPTDMVGRLEGYAPFAAARRRLTRLQLSTDVAVQKVADAVVEGVLYDRSRVRLPRRTAVWPALQGVPQRVVEVLLHGLPRRVDDPATTGQR